MFRRELRTLPPKDCWIPPRCCRRPSLRRCRRGRVSAIEPDPVVIDVAELYRADGETARQELERRTLELAGEGRKIVLTGRGPIWLYLRLAHALHGVARTLTYRAPEAGDVLVFDHTSR